MQEATTYYDHREETLGAEVLREVERQVMLRIIEPAVAGASLRDGLPAGGHQPPGDGVRRTRSWSGSVKATRCSAG